MNCIKCGREIPEGSMFCQECKLPPVTLPETTAAPKKAKAPKTKKKKRRKKKKFDFSKTIRQLRIALLVVSLLLAGLTALVALRVNAYLERTDDLRHREANLILRENEADNRDARIAELETQLEKALAYIETLEHPRRR